MVPDTPLGGEELQRKSGFWRCFLVSRGRGVNPPLPPLEAFFLRGFWKKTHQKRVFCSKIREERRPIRAHLPFSLSPQEALFIRDFWLKRSKNVFFAPKYAKKEGQSGLPYHFPCPRQEAIFIRGFWQKRIKNVFFAPQYAKKEGQSGLICHFPCLPKRPYLFVISG